MTSNDRSLVNNGLKLTPLYPKVGFQGDFCRDPLVVGFPSLKIHFLEEEFWVDFHRENYLEWDFTWPLSLYEYNTSRYEITHNGA